MRIIIDIGHPGHVHLFRFYAEEMTSRGHIILFTYREKEHEAFLLRKFGFQAASVGRHYASFAGKTAGLVMSVIKMLSVSKRFRPDLFLSHGSLIAAQSSRILGKPHIALEDTGNREQVRLYLPFTKAVLTSEAFQGDYGEKQIRYRSFHEMAYLRPRYFTPEREFRKLLGVGPDDRLIMLRFISWKATHDRGSKGLSDSEKTEMVEELSKHGKLIISSERELPEGLKKYRYPLSPDTVHQALASADIFVSEGATMASEACVLGVPSIYINPQVAGTINQYVNRGLMFQFYSSKGSVEKAREILNDPESKEKFNRNREKLLSETVDLTQLLVWFTENWPQSFNILKSDPEFQNKFV